MDELKYKALELGASDLGLSQVKTKKYYVIYNDKKINFGSAHGKTFLDHKDKDIRANWIKRHSQIKDKNGVHVMTKKTSPSFWSYKILC
jgi:hypothetical protein